MQTSMRDFQVVRKLGEGAFAEVYEVRRREDSETYAMKKIKLVRMKEKERENALNQVRILASYSDPNIIGHKQTFYDSVSCTLCIVMEYAGRGDILKLVQTHTKQRTVIEEKEVWRALVHIAQGLRALHERNILHRDLKCANVFITKEGVYKVGDLNVSKVLTKEMARTQTGTPYYASPQVWKDKPYNAKSDMWSLGCVLYEMAAQQPPFTAPNMESLYKRILGGQYARIPVTYSNELAKVIASLLKINPNERPSAGELLRNKAVHEHYQGQFGEKPIEEEDDLLLKTFKINHRNLKSIQESLPKSNYSMKRIKTEKSIESKVGSESVGQKTQRRDNSNQSRECSSNVKGCANREINFKVVDVPLLPPPIIQPKQNKQLRVPNKIEEDACKRAIDSYLLMKKKAEEKEREAARHLEGMLVKKRERVQSACRLQTPSPPRRKMSKEAMLVPLSAKGSRKEEQKPRIVDRSNKMPPLPPTSKKIVNQEDVLDKYLQNEALKKRQVSQEKDSEEKVRKHSLQKIVYPSWWMFD